MNARKRGILIGAAAGALLGALIAWVYADARGDEDTNADQRVPLSPADWIRLGIAILGVARQLGDLIKRT